MQTFFSIS